LRFFFSCAASRAEEYVAKGFVVGVIQEFKGGTTNISGYMTVREKMIKEINELSKHFGFSFKDRSKLVDKKKLIKPNLYSTNF
jgi:hypothetical protein